MKENRMAFLLSSADSYSDTWEPFFTLLEKYWSDIPYPVFLNTETKNFDNDKINSFTVNSVNTSTKISWSQRMLNVLDKIDQDYVFLVLDDFFLKSKVDSMSFEKILDKLDSDSTIASFQLNASRLVQEGKVQNIKSWKVSEVIDDGWKTHFVPTIWRKSVLIKWLRRHESIWGFELYGSQRARIWKYKEKVFAIESPILYDYLWINGCSAIVNGRWLNSPELDKFFINNNLNINLKKRGRIDIAEYRSKTLKDTLHSLTISQIIKKTVLRFRSLW